MTKQRSISLTLSPPKKETRPRSGSLATTKRKIQKKQRTQTKLTHKRQQIRNKCRIKPGSGKTGSKNGVDMDSHELEPGDKHCNETKWDEEEKMYELLKTKDYEYDGFVVPDSDPIIYEEGVVEVLEVHLNQEEESDEEEGYFSCGSENE